MDKKEWLEVMTGQMQTEKLLETNGKSKNYGLTLSEEDAKLLAAERSCVLKQQKRVEFGESILPELIYEFCDSQYISQESYVETLMRLQEIFFMYKNEMMDEITDRELLNFMKEQFETICCGDPDYLEGTCLEIFSEAVRAGYQGHQKTEGKEVYGRFDEVKRWDRELYLEALRDLCWR